MYLFRVLPVEGNKWMGFEPSQFAYPRVFKMWLPCFCLQFGVCHRATTTKQTGML